MKSISLDAVYKPRTNNVLDSFLPQPNSSLGTAFSGLVRGAKSVLGGAGGGSMLIGIEDQYAELLHLQMKMNDLAQRTNLESNIEKARHDTKMAPIRNIRVN